MDALKTISDASLKQEVPAFAVGDTVKVHVRIKEGDKSRIQVFEGTVIAKKHGGISETFTVRRVGNNVAYGCFLRRCFYVVAGASGKSGNECDNACKHENNRYYLFHDVASLSSSVI